MPLKRGYSRKTFELNYAEMVRAGRPHNVALAACYKSARESYFKAHPHGALPRWLVPKGGKRLKNPVPPSKKVQLRNAAKLYGDFTGHEAELVDTIDKPVLPDVMLVIGDLDFIGYTTVRDGETEKYIHKFQKKCRPLFMVSHDGKQLFLLGGSYDFTELGIVDKT
jgi:hypothetical protein